MGELETGWDKVLSSCLEGGPSLVHEILQKDGLGMLHLGHLGVNVPQMI